MKSSSTVRSILFLSFFGLISLLILPALGRTQKKDMARPTFENTVLEYEARVAEADYLFQVLDWNANLHSNDEGLVKLQTIYEGKLQDLKNDEESFKRIKALKEYYDAKKAKGTKPEITSKWYRFLERFIVLDPKARTLQKEEMEFKNRLSSVWNVYRPFMKDGEGKYIKDPKTGKDKKFNNSEISRILATSKDRDERRRAFEAKSQVGFEIAKNGFKDLVKLRNEYARARGYKDFYSMQYSYAGFDEDRIFEIFDTVLRETDGITKKAVDSFVRENGYEKFEPWDAEYASMGFSSLIDDYLPKDGMIDILQSSFKALGLDLEKQDITMDLEPRPGKYPHAACWWVKFATLDKGKWAGEDMRLIANLDKGGYDQYSTLFHETGHAVHGANIRQKYVIDNNVNLTSYFEMGGITEGIAVSFEKIMGEKEWFLKYADYKRLGKTEEEMKKAFAAFEAKAKPWNAFNLRALMQRVYFERAIYKDPDGDFNKIWWDNMQRFLFMERHDDLPHWAHKVHFITPAGYYQFYVLADLISEQTNHHLKAKFGSIVDNPNVGKELVRSYFVPGNSIPWEESLKRLTGERLNPKYRIDAVTKF